VNGDRNGSRRSFGTVQLSRTCDPESRITARLSTYWVEISERLQIDEEVDPGEPLRAEIPQPLLQRRRVAPGEIDIVVREEQAACALQHIEFDHVDARLERGVKRCKRVSGRDQISALVSDSDHS
jgi:hypothetical protein